MSKFSPNTLASMGVGRSMGVQPSTASDSQAQAAAQANVGSAPRKFAMNGISNIQDDLAVNLSVPIAISLGFIVWLYLRFAE